MDLHLLSVCTTDPVHQVSICLACTKCWKWLLVVCLCCCLWTSAKGCVWTRFSYSTAQEKNKHATFVHTFSWHNTHIHTLIASPLWEDQQGAAFPEKYAQAHSYARKQTAQWNVLLRLWRASAAIFTVVAHWLIDWLAKRKLEQHIVELKVFVCVSKC